MRRREIGRAGWGRTASCALIGIVYFLPVLWIVLTAFKTPRDALTPTLLFTPTLDNFAAVFARVYYRGGEVLDTGFDLYFVNSVVVSGASVGLALVLGTAAAYGFSRWPLRGNDTYLLVILTTRMLHPDHEDATADHSDYSDLPDVPPERAGGQLSRHHPALHGVQSALRRLDNEELLRRTAARGGGRGAHRRQLGTARVLSGLPARRSRPASPRPRPLASS